MWHISFCNKLLVVVINNFVNYTYFDMFQIVTTGTEAFLLTTLKGLTIVLKQIMCFYFSPLFLVYSITIA